MKTSAMVVFLFVVLIVYGLTNTYIYIRGLQSFPSAGHARTIYSLIFWFFAGTYIMARILERSHPGIISYIFTWIGSFWLAIMLFAFLFVVLIDLVRLGNGLFHYFPDWSVAQWQKVKLLAFWSVTGIVVFHVLIGFINSRIVRLKELEITVAQRSSSLDYLKILLATDIHLGTIISRAKVEKLVTLINSRNPDLVLFAGDVVDEDLAPVIKENLGESLRKLKSRFGVFAVTGNHEFIGGAEAAVNYLENHGVRVLQDTTILIDSVFNLAGREDRDKHRFTGKNRKELEQVLENVDPNYPVILMDHQPFSLEKPTSQGVDLQVSGHTHHGQIWPLNYITQAIYEISMGYKKKENTHFYVSCGYGTWGPPVRLGNRPEVVEIRINFRNQR